MKNSDNGDNLLNVQMVPDTVLSIVHALLSIDDLIYSIEFPTGNQGGTLTVPHFVLELGGQVVMAGKVGVVISGDGQTNCIGSSHYKALGVCCFISRRWKYPYNALCLKNPTPST